MVFHRCCESFCFEKNMLTGVRCKVSLKGMLMLSNCLRPARKGNTSYSRRTIYSSVATIYSIYLASLANLSHATV